HVSSALFPYTTLFRSAERAVHRHVERSRLAVHGAPAADDQIGMPDQVEAIERGAGNPDPAVREEIGPASAQRIRLLVVARKRHRSEEHTSELQSRFDL